ncbi:hypothetical protein [Sulfuriferula sp. AH1]|uniref:hypothetical protein n=1 Tax=Sulfuriferula sp. AH1 TaxID=1985873 RepID=UPI0012FB4CAD|nr:hypothetical protein [Sulfuriferula sp. AH1]
MAKPNKGVMVPVLVKTPVTYNDESFAAGDLLQVDEIHLQQLLDVGAVERVKDADQGGTSDSQSETVG